ncbi:hypothetical protein [Streptomyces sp. NPDC052036]|uniref:hypothetical protein n=1 Tax=unclassified Streptomyces TaxID=2593676 RepID=UPI0034137626
MGEDTADRPARRGQANAGSTIAQATIGAAAPRLGGVGAKTGTAQEGDHTNGRLTAYNSRIMVEGGSSGVDSAG